MQHFSFSLKFFKFKFFHLIFYFRFILVKENNSFAFTFNHLADAFIQRDLQMRRVLVNNNTEIYF